MGMLDVIHLDHRERTLVEPAKLHDLDPAAYRHPAIIAAARGELLLPWTFAKAAAARQP